MERKPLGIAVIGVGRIGFYHAGIVKSSVPTLKLLMVMDMDRGVASRTSSSLDVPWTASVDNVLARDDVDAVLIATPSDEHVDLVKRSAAAGKSIFVEKPISIDMAGTLEAVRAAEQAGVYMQVGFQFRYEPSIAKAHEAIRRGEFGEIYFFRCSHRDAVPPTWEFIRKSGGMLIDDTIHDFDLARFLVGEIVGLSCMGADKAPGFAEHGDLDTAITTVKFANGAVGVIDNTRVAGYGFELSLEVMGSKGALRFGPRLRSATELLVPGSVSSRLVLRGREVYAEAFVAQLDAFANAVAAKKSPSNVGDAVTALALSLAANQSIATQQVVRVA